ncbi:ankyrin repeat and fibronectin type-III domain-containing protein 1-like isoform X2 [Babylonia areolata]|uniref:ankyrin repeat and fibronectin type-III domain-containing protein 1-like isoform X2 n=1 Tax=Babylonia areolata TaxID=304850 RepID=UPI003FD3DFEC
MKNSEHGKDPPGEHQDVRADGEGWTLIRLKPKPQELLRSKSWRGRKSSLRLFSHAQPRSQDDVDAPASEVPRPPVRPRSAWSFEDDAAVSTSSLDTPSDVRMRRSSAAHLFYTPPPRSNMVRGPESERRLESAGSLYKFARKLSQRDKGGKDSRHRSISVDGGDGRTLKMVTADDQQQQQQQHQHHHHHYHHHHHQQQQQQQPAAADKQRGQQQQQQQQQQQHHHHQLESLEVAPTMTGSPSAPAFLTKEGQIASPVLSKDTRLLRKKGSTNDLDSSKAERRKSDKEKKVIYDSSALFEAVEQQDLDAVKAILDSRSVDVNSLNAENLSVLDIALMTNNIPMAKMLLLQGARESPMFQHGGSRGDRLDLLVSEAEQRVVDLTALVLNGASGNVSMSPTQLRDHEQHLNHCEFRHRLLKRMKAGYDYARPPDPPTQVTLTVASNCSLLVTFHEPLNHNGAVVTKYRVEWSCQENFVPLTGEAIVEDLRHLEHEMKGLTKGCRYYVRVSACNVKGYGGHTLSSPSYAVPSSWREVEGTVSRLEGKVQSLQVLFDQVRRSRPPEAAEVKDTCSTDSPQQKKRISIKSLFSAPKFQKTVKRGVHLAVLLVCEGRVLVTSEEQVPIVEVDENFSGTSIQSELYWLMKIACTWEDVKLLRQDMEKTKSAGTTFRTKLLQAIASLQNSLGMQDLGKFFHRPLRAANGSLLLTLVNQVRDTKFVGLGSSRWVSLRKLGRRQSLPSMDIGEAHNLLIASIPEMLMYREVCELPLPKGLYLGFLKIQVSVESVRILVPLRAPNVLPYARIRDCPNVSSEEWEWLQNLDSGSPSTQPEFFAAIQKAATKLFTQLGISVETAAGYRLYDVEVVEMGPGVSFLVLLPPVEQVCIAPGQSDHLADRKDCVLLPVQVFETIHMNTYQPQMFASYARLSSITDMDMVLAQQAQREAFSTEELSAAKDQLEVSSHLQQNLDRLWKSTRWIMDLITFARRDKFLRPPVSTAPLFLPQGSTTGTTTHSHASVSKPAPPPLSLSSSSSSPSPSPQLPDPQGRLHSNSSSNSQAEEDENSTSNEISVGKDHRRIAKFFDPNDEDDDDDDDDIAKDTAQHGGKGSATSLTDPEGGGGGGGENDEMLPPSSPSSSTSSSPSSPLTSGILRVYAAYDTGLSKGVSVKLHVTAHTTARDVVHLVVRHLSLALAERKGRQTSPPPPPAYTDPHPDSFCLVAVMGARERVLGDDYPPLRLQNPWLKGRLYVRLVNNVMEAIQQGQATAV